MTRRRSIRRSELERLRREHRELADLLRAWPARQILMDYEKEWNERRLEILANCHTEDSTSHW